MGASVRLGVFTFGSRGDFQPYLALAVALRKRGFDVLLGTNDEHAPMARAYGFDPFFVSGDVQAILGSPEGQAWVASGSNPIHFVRRAMELVKPTLRSICDDTVRMIEEVDAIVYSPIGAGAGVLAARKGIPAVIAGLQPWSLTREFSSPLIGDGKSLGAWGNFLSHWLVEEATWAPIRRIGDRWGVDRFGVSPFPARGPLRQARLDKHPIVYGYSEHVVPRPRDWEDHIDITGYWFLDRLSDYAPPDDLARFLAAGPPPVYVGFGSMTDRDPGGTANVVLETVRRLGVRCVLSSGWMKMHPKELPNNVLVVGSVPHDWLFPQMAAVVHHGGAGTTSAGFRAGVPMVVVPFFADQGFWAERARRLGVAPAGVPKKKLTADRLTRALARTLEDESMRRAAADTGNTIRKERGGERAAERIERIVTNASARA